MQAIDRHAIETVGIPRLLLMEHAGLAIARAARSLLPQITLPIAVCCGMGFNGGDGLSAARHLHQWGYTLEVLLAGKAKNLREEPAIYANILHQLGLKISEFETAKTLSGLEDKLSGCGLVIDGLLGIGSKGKVREPVASLINRLNALGKPILAVDIPSGLDADSGSVQGTAIKAAMTVAFGRIKQGCVKGEGAAHSGRIVVDSITLPPSLLNS